MISRLLYRCPHCGAEPWLVNGCCRTCGARVRVGPDRMTVTIAGRTAPMGDWYAALRHRDRLPPGGRSGGPVALSSESRAGIYRGPGGLCAVQYGRRPLGEAWLHLTAERIEVRGPSLEITIGLAEVTALTIESHTVIVATRDRGVFFLDVAQGAGKRWEDALGQCLAIFHAPRRIVETCPRLRFFDGPVRPKPAADAAGKSLLANVRAVAEGRAAAGFDILRAAARRLLGGLLPLRVEGRGRVPAAGPVVIAANHSSFLDAILLAAFSPRPIWFMTKNSQFAHRWLARFLVWARAFPVRRYTSDPVAVRNALRVLAGGEVLGLFPEGERSWDGRMLPFKRTTVRLLLALGIPVVPVGIAGAYGLMPRWTGRIRRRPVVIRFGAPLDLPYIRSGAQTAADIDRAAGRLRDAIEELKND